MDNINKSRGSNSHPKERRFVAARSSNMKRMVEAIKRLNPGPYKCGGNANTTTKKLPAGIRSAVAFFTFPILPDKDKAA